MRQNRPSRVHFAATVAAGLLTIAAIPGRDFVPADWATSGSLEVAGAESFILLDAFALGAETWLLYIDPATPGTITLDAYDPTDGPTGAMSGSPTIVLAPDTTAGSVEARGLNAAQLARCSTKHVTGVPLAWDGALYRTNHIGVLPSSLRVSGNGGVCSSLRVTRGSVTPGYENGATYTTDGFALSNPGTCVNFTAAYDFTTCSFAGTAAYRCAMSPDPVADADAERGACQFFLMYEAISDGDNDPGTIDDRALLTAHARDLDGTWTRYLPSGATVPGLTDVRVRNTSEHGGDGGANLHSFVSVPTLWYDAGTGLWRMWFVTEEAGGASIRYSESDDNGQSWGIGGGAGSTIDCWTGTQFDDTACTGIAWTGTPPPDDVTVPDIRSPDTLDPEVLYGNFDGLPGSELGMMFTGGDDGCADGDWGVQLWQLHREGGDQSNGTNWTWTSAVAADAVDGVVIDLDDTACASGGTLMDAEIVPYRRGYLGFFNARGGIHVAGSGYRCSDFADNDASGATDWPADADCANPWDGSE